MSLEIMLRKYPGPQGRQGDAPRRGPSQDNTKKEIRAVVNVRPTRGWIVGRIIQVGEIRTDKIYVADGHFLQTQELVKLYLSVADLPYGRV